ncbi:hypothetical protein L596_021210 [Steinernema carpocapsae]|uniref:Uncharacterized protein n=1 Tax=Steinernema carpocapsae TaxID=34508 RepID=A0A4V6A1A6_STECR|nr:hypothetical protein L596_021210 [Steinernema carpocapsae]
MNLCRRQPHHVLWMHRLPVEEADGVCCQHSVDLWFIYRKENATLETCVAEVYETPQFLRRQKLFLEVKNNVNQ